MTSLKQHWTEATPLNHVIVSYDQRKFSTSLLGIGDMEGSFWNPSQQRKKKLNMVVRKTKFKTNSN